MSLSDIQLIKDKIDVVSLLSEYITLKKSGANYKACCPFHQEKSPSFMVHKEKQIWHCFGCGKGGDIFAFIQEMEGLEFGDALKLLADRAGVKLTNYKPDINKGKKERLFEVTKAAMNFFHHFLLEIPSASSARAYVFEKRELQKTTVDDFKIGFIPEQWDLLTKYLLKKGFAVDDLVDAGLTIKKTENATLGHGFYDRFRGRIMFPIWDVHDNVVGFTGRQLVENKEAGGKYVNTPETAIFDKSRVLYGLNKARMAIKNQDLAILVEGQMDVIACHQAGIKNVVASSGTALTEAQVNLIKRYTENIAFAFDADLAGMEASKRGVDIALNHGMNVKVIQIPKDGGKDADECIKKNKQMFLDAIKNAQEVMVWHFNRILPKYDLSNPKQKQIAVDELIAEISKIQLIVEKEEWLKRLARDLDIDFSILKEVARKDKTIKLSQHSSSKPENQNSIQKTGNRQDQLIFKLWSVLLKEPKFYAKVRGDLRADFFANGDFFPLYQIFEKEYNEKHKINAETLEISLPQEIRELVAILQLSAEKDLVEISDKDLLNEAQNLARIIKNEYLKNLREELYRQLRAAENTGDSTASDKILEQINNLKI